MIRFELTDEDRAECRRRAEALGQLRNSIMKGESNAYGVAGELIAMKFYGSDIAEIKDTRDYDILLADGTKVDVKSKKTGYEPEPHWDCSVAGYNTQQKCDKYLFVRVHESLSHGWVLGEMPKQEFFNKATFWQQGQYDPRNRWRCKADCYSLEISGLNEAVKPEIKKDETV